MPLAFHVHNTSTNTYNFHILAQYMAAFHKAIRMLKQYFDILQSLPTLSSMSPTQLFPYPVTYISLITDNKAKKIYIPQAAIWGQAHLFQLQRFFQWTTDLHKVHSTVFNWSSLALRSFGMCPYVAWFPEYPWWLGYGHHGWYQWGALDVILQASLRNHQGTHCQEAGEIPPSRFYAWQYLRYEHHGFQLGWEGFQDYRLWLGRESQWGNISTVH